MATTLACIAALLLAAAHAQPEMTCENCPAENRLSTLDGTLPIGTIDVTGYSYPKVYNGKSILDVAAMQLVATKAPKTPMTFNIPLVLPVDKKYVKSCVMKVKTKFCTQLFIKCGDNAEEEVIPRPWGIVESIYPIPAEGWSGFDSCTIRAFSASMEMYIFGFSAEACVITDWCDFPPWPECEGCGMEEQTREKECACPNPDPSQYVCFDAETTETRMTDCGCCPVDCEWADWGPWDACDVTCGIGTQSRERGKDTDEECGGTCDGDDSETKECDAGCCPVDCFWGDWEDWSDCDAECGIGTQSRTRPKLLDEYCGGECDGDDSETRECDAGCCPVDCFWADWGDWSDCDVSCGMGTESRSRFVLIPESCGGTCEGDDEETQECDAGCCPEDCVMDEWNDWSDCDVTCGIGTKSRSRDVLIPESCGGTCDEDDEETEECDAGCCPEDCVWDDWGEWTECDASCGTGTQSRSRNILIPASCGGADCDGEESETRECDAGCCPVDCVMDDWGDWSDCDVSCGMGTESRSRDVLIPESCGGTCEEDDEETKECDAGCCPEDCVWDDWGEWTECDASCGTGTQSRSRNVLIPESCGGAGCDGEDSETRECDAGCCPVDCVMDDWGEWSDCDVSCGLGTESRSRDVLIPESCGGSCEEDDEETQECDAGCCPEDCIWDEWADWSECDASCGMGTQSRLRYVLLDASCGGTCEGDDEETQECDAGCCPVDCVMDDWGDWSDCDVSCGTGTEIRSRDVLIPESCGGSCDEDDEETQECDAGCCPEDCTWEDWGEWSDCDVSCGMGTQSRSRDVLEPESCGGTCEGDDQETQECDAGCCPEDCIWDEWADWSECDASCGMGTQSRSRDVLVDASCGGSCEGDDEETQECDAGCCPEDCIWDEWADWSECDVPCGMGTQSRSRDVLVDASCGGTCEGDDEETQECDAGCCPEDCTWNDWGEWSDCDVSCGMGTESRSRDVLEPATCDGTCEGDDLETQECDAGCCPEDCIWDEWADWSECDVPCGLGTHARSRDVLVDASCGGTCEGDSEETEECDAGCCPEECVWDEWAEWSDCDVSCGMGTESRSRDVLVPASCDGACEGDYLETQECDAGCCPEDCIWNPWSDWSFCDVSCEMGTQTRTRDVLVDASCGGTCEGDDLETQECDAGCCPVDCEWMPWGEWIGCDVTCGMGTDSRSRELLIPESCGGTCEGDDQETQECDAGCCPVDCIWMDWNPWGECDVSCGDGTHDRTRDKLVPEECGGTCDGEDSETQTCNAGCCPVDCTWDAWGTWDECDVSCGEGTQSRSRDKLIPEECEGDCEGDDTETQNCDMGCCPVDCVYNEWNEWSRCSVTCGGTGVEERTRDKLVPEECGGNCDQPDRETRSCDSACCPDDQSIWNFANRGDISKMKFVSTKPKSDTVFSQDPYNILQLSGTNSNVMSQNSAGEDTLRIDFSPLAQLVTVSIDFRFQSVIKMQVFDESGTVLYDGEEIYGDTANGYTPWATAAWHPEMTLPEAAYVIISFPEWTPSGEVKVSGLYFVVCPTREREDCVCRVRGDPVVENCMGDLLFLDSSSVGQQLAVGSADSDCPGISIYINNVMEGQALVPESVIIQIGGSQYVLDINGNVTPALPASPSSSVSTMDGMTTVAFDCGLSVSFKKTENFSIVNVNIPGDLQLSATGFCF